MVLIGGNCHLLIIGNLVCFLLIQILDGPLEITVPYTRLQMVVLIGLVRIVIAVQHLEMFFLLTKISGLQSARVGQVRRTTDGGQNWTTQISGTFSYLLSVSFIDANSGWIATIDGTILRTTNGGIDWALESIGLTVSLRSICFKDLNNGTVIGLICKNI